MFIISIGGAFNLKASIGFVSPPLFAPPPPPPPKDQQLDFAKSGL